jgi:hypothetical protein
MQPRLTLSSCPPEYLNYRPPECLDYRQVPPCLGSPNFLNCNMKIIIAASSILYRLNEKLCKANGCPRKAITMVLLWCPCTAIY